MKFSSLFHNKKKKSKSRNEEQDYDLYIENYDDYVQEDYLVDRKSLTTENN